MRLHIRSIYLRAAIVNLLAFSTGIVLSWTSPVLTKLDDTSNPDNPLGRPTTMVEEAWIASITPLLAILGCVVAPTATEKFGKKKILMSLSFPFLASLLMLAFSEDVVLFLVGRAVGGVAAGSAFSILPVYLAEIAQNHNRGILGCSFSIFLALGVLFTYLVGPFLSVQNFCLVSTVPLIMFFPMFYLWCTESPNYLAAINDQAKLKATIARLRRKTHMVEVENEVLEITKINEDFNRNRLGIKSLFCDKILRKGLLITVSLVIFQQFSGYAVIVFYMQTIFEESETDLTPAISTIIVGAIQLFAACISSLTIDRLGRRFLLLFSTIGCCFSLVVLGAYFFFLEDLKYEMDAIFWLPVICLIVFMLSYNVGLGPATWTVMGEIFSPNVKSVAATITTGVSFFIAFLIIFFFPYIEHLLGMAQSFWVFAIICGCGIVFVYLGVPETKGKSLREIQILLD